MWLLSVDVFAKYVSSFCAIYCFKNNHKLSKLQQYAAGNQPIQEDLKW